MGAILNGKRHVGVTYGDSMHLTAMGALNF
jgi:hypothetical protein